MNYEEVAQMFKDYSYDRSEELPQAPVEEDTEEIRELKHELEVA